MAAPTAAAAVSRPHPGAPHPVTCLRARAAGNYAAHMIRRGAHSTRNMRTTGAATLIRSLQAEGVDTVFALPGAQIMSAFDAIHDRPEVRLVTTRHEQATTYMADGYARVTGRPGVAMVVPGPGALNAAAGLGTAYSLSSPVLLISGQIPSAALGRGQGQLHEMDDQLDAMRPLTRWRRRVTAAGDIPAAVREAFRQMRTGRPRPVELEIPPDILDAQSDAEPVETTPVPSVGPPASDIARAAEILASSQRPAIAAGGGALRAGAGGELMRVATLLQAPVVTSPQGRGLMPPDHPLYVGVHYAGLGASAGLLGESDVILAVGTRLLIKDFELSSGQSLIKLDADRRELSRAGDSALAIHTDAKPGLAALADRLEAAAGRPPEGRNRAARFRNRHWSELERDAPVQLEWVQAIRAGTASDAVIVAGMTTIGYWSYIAFNAQPQGVFMTPGYFGALGYGFPTALGAKVGAPHRQVVSITGDGGFMYNVQELATARQHRINIAIVLFDNAAFGASLWDQGERWGGRAIGTELINPDWRALAAAFGIPCLRAESPPQLTHALERALALDQPVLIHVPIPNMAPPFQLPGRIGW